MTNNNAVAFCALGLAIGSLLGDLIITKQKKPVAWQSNATYTVTNRVVDIERAIKEAGTNELITIFYMKDVITTNTIPPTIFYFGSKPYELGLRKDGVVVAREWKD